MNKLGELFKFFKLTPRVFDPLIDEARIALAAVREPEREIMRLLCANATWIEKSSLKVFRGRKVTAAGGPHRT